MTNKFKNNLLPFHLFSPEYSSLGYAFYCFYVAVRLLPFFEDIAAHRTEPSAPKEAFSFKDTNLNMSLEKRNRTVCSPKYAFISSYTELCKHGICVWAWEMLPLYYQIFLWRRLFPWMNNCIWKPITVQLLLTSVELRKHCYKMAQTV